MGFWSTLAHIGGAVAAPFTGGLSMIPAGIMDATNAVKGSGPSTASAIGQTAGSIEQQRMQALIAQAKLQQEQDALGLQRTNAGVNVGNLDLNQRKQALAAPGQEAHNSVQGDILANAQDAHFSNLPSYVTMPTMSGGLRPSMLSAASRATGGQMSRNAMLNTMSGKDSTFAPLPTVPGATPLPSANAFDKILQGGAIGGSFLDALKGVGGKGSPSQPGGSVAGDQSFAGPDQNTDPSTFAGPTQAGDPSTLTPDQGGSGIDPSILEWLKQQADPTKTGQGSNG